MCTGKSHPCHENDLKCENGGSCVVKNGVPHCICTDGYDGQFCHFMSKDTSISMEDVKGSYQISHNISFVITL